MVSRVLVWNFDHQRLFLRCELWNPRVCDAVIEDICGFLRRTILGTSRYASTCHLQTDLDVFHVFLASTVVYRDKDPDIVANKVLLLLKVDPSDALGLLEAHEAPNVARDLLAYWIWLAGNPGFDHHDVLVTAEGRL